MHHPQCVQRARECKIGREGHCAECPHRGQHDPRWTRLQRIRSLASSVEHGYPVELVEEEFAAILWPPSEREWIDRGGEHVERARYWSSMHTQALIRELLIEIHDLKADAAFTERSAA